MAARRIAKSAIDWTAFGERVPAAQKDFFRSFKAKSDKFVTRVHQYPENLPKIDFAMYKTRLANPAMVDQFEKAYASLQIAYPKDSKNMLADIDSQQKKAEEETAAFIQQSRKAIDEAKSTMSHLEKLPPVDELTMEHLKEFFPESAADPKNPTFWPHTKSAQKGNNPNHIE